MGLLNWYHRAGVFFGEAMFSLLFFARPCIIFTDFTKRRLLHG